MIVCLQVGYDRNITDIIGDWKLAGLAAKSALSPGLSETLQQKGTLVSSTCDKNFHIIYIHSQEAEINEYVRQPLEQGFQGWDWWSKSTVSWVFWCFLLLSWLLIILWITGNAPPPVSRHVLLCHVSILRCVQRSLADIHIYIYYIFIYIYKLYTVHVVLQGCLGIDNQDWKHYRIRMHGCILYMWPLMGR